MMAAIIEWWKSLAQREQKILLFGGVIAVLLLIYALIWSPFSSAISSMRQSVTTNKNLAVWMTHATKRLQQLQKSGIKAGGIGDESLLTFIDSSTRSNQLHRFITQLEQASDQQQVVLKFEQVPFDILINWLTSIWQQNGVQVVSATMQPAKKAGTTKVELVLNK